MVLNLLAAAGFRKALINQESHEMSNCNYLFLLSLLVFLNFCADYQHEQLYVDSGLNLAFLGILWLYSNVLHALTLRHLSFGIKTQQTIKNLSSIFLEFLKVQYGSHSYYGGRKAFTGSFHCEHSFR